MDFIPDNIIYHLLILAATFLVIYKAADFLVDGAVGIAYKLNVPKIVIGVILVGFGTTAPEFTVSVLSAIRGFPEIALGNAVGSVIVDDTLALGLGIIVAPMAIRVERRSLRLFGLFLVGIDILAFTLSLNGIISRWEGLLLLGILAVYLVYVIYTENRKRKIAPEVNEELAGHIKPGGTGHQLLRFFLGLAGVVVASEFHRRRAERIRRSSSRGHHWSGYPQYSLDYRSRIRRQPDPGRAAGDFLCLPLDARGSRSDAYSGALALRFTALERVSACYCVSAIYSFRYRKILFLTPP
jgi:Ca2+/Na+ antiporter